MYEIAAHRPVSKAFDLYILPETTEELAAGEIERFRAHSKVQER
ncbi:hypothetical protein BVRB_2g038070 [Beta vulgaris subsp. vulgaris]|nr:hypothetical protein BVRB_2g038070 [Beta vulgaris subsp. vulgaris]